MAIRNNRQFISLMSKGHVFWYQLLGGAGLLGRMGKAPVLLLTTTGRESGKRRTTPLMYGWDGDTVIVIASNSGADRDPGWWRNLKAHPDATIQIHRETIAIHAEQASPEEKARLWAVMAKLYPTYDEYQLKTVRPIPVVLLKRVGRS